MLESSVVIFLVMILFAFKGKSRGALDFRFHFEAFLLTTLIFPFTYQLVKLLLKNFMSISLASGLSLTFNLILLYVVIIELIRIPIKKIENENDKKNGFLGFIYGALKGFLVIALIIMLYAVFQIDKKAPVLVTYHLKHNLVNKVIEKPVEFYRKTGFDIYNWIIFSEVTDISKSEDFREQKMPSYGKEQSWLLDNANK